MYFLLEEINGEKFFIQAMPWGGLTIIGTQTPTSPIPEIWKQRKGDYLVSPVEPDDVPTIEKATITEECGFLVLSYGFNDQLSFGQNSTLALNLTTDYDAFVWGYGRGGGEGVLFSPDGNSFRYMGLKFSRVK